MTNIIISNAVPGREYHFWHGVPSGNGKGIIVADRNISGEEERHWRWIMPPAATRTLFVDPVFA